jgi:hypothetical protein
MAPFENYLAPAENIFDTGTPANPYPSIMGNHTGTITPKQTITVSQLYTYPCVDTGGHTESTCYPIITLTIIKEERKNGSKKL